MPSRTTGGLLPPVPPASSSLPLYWSRCWRGLSLQYAGRSVITHHATHLHAHHNSFPPHGYFIAFCGATLLETFTCMTCPIFFDKWVLFHFLGRKWRCVVIAARRVSVRERVGSAASPCGTAAAMSRPTSPARWPLMAPDDPSAQVKVTRCSRHTAQGKTGPRGYLPARWRWTSRILDQYSGYPRRWCLLSSLVTMMHPLSPFTVVLRTHCMTAFSQPKYYLEVIILDAIETRLTRSFLDVFLSFQFYLRRDSRWILQRSIHWS